MTSDDRDGQAGPGRAPLFIRASVFRAFSDVVQLRDPAGRSRRPHLVPARLGGEPGVLARGPFLIQLRYAVRKSAGATFCRATGDANTIHTEGDVVPGAYTAARVLLPIEVVFPGLDIARFTVRFTAIATYERALVTRIRCEPGPDGARFVAATSEAGGPDLADVEVETRWRTPRRTVPEVARRKVNVERLRAVCRFVRCLGLAPYGYFGAGSESGYCYPKSFLAALPSGAMVRQLRGEGALLNKLSLDFGDAPVPITGLEDPTVQIERPRVRRTFNKILAAITDGLRTYVRGSALVLSRGAPVEAAPVPDGLSLGGAALAAPAR